MKKVRLFQKEKYLATPKILLTTSDYLPQLGGLTSYTLNLEKCLNKLDLQYDVHHWKSGKKLRLPLSEYTHIFNVHYMGGYFLRPDFQKQKVINFIHGSEILFYSNNYVKKIIKNVLKKNQMN